MRRRLALAIEEKRRADDKQNESNIKYEETVELIEKYENERKELDERGNNAEEGIEILEGILGAHIVYTI